ncbi:MAG: translation initiation factor IF-3 [Parcubacteria group bacterium]|nr:translation initiation factor IF-3 [Parcubacteria group bacterium]
MNKSILAKELRVMGADGANLGVISKDEALRQAETAGLDLIEISPKANPPVAKIMDYGKFQYEQKKKQKEIKAKSHTTETKNIQIKMGTGEHDLSLKSKRISEWLKEGHRVKIDLFLFGRYKYMEFNFLKERLEKFLTLITEEYKVAEAVKKSPKGLTTVIEKTK